MKYQNTLARLCVAMIVLALNTGCSKTTRITQTAMAPLPPPGLPPGVVGAPAGGPLQNALPAQLDPPPVIPDLVPGGVPGALADTGSTSDTKPAGTPPSDKPTDTGAQTDATQIAMMPADPAQTPPVTGIPVPSQQPLPDPQQLVKDLAPHVADPSQNPG